MQNIVVKIDASGVKQWELPIDNYLLPNGLKDIVPTSDGGFLLAGDTRDTQIKQEVWLVKISAAGSIVWNKSFGYAALDEQVAQVIALSDGNFMVTGTVLDIGNNNNFFLAKADADGNNIWQKTYNKPGYQNAYDLLESTDGGFVMLGETYQTTPAKVSLLKTDSDGNEQWFQQLNSSLSNDQSGWLFFLRSFTRDNAGNLYIALNTNIDQAVGTGLTLIKTNSQGVALDYFPVSNNDYVKRILVTATQNLLLTGGDESAQSFLIKTDLDGQIFSNKINGSVFNDGNDNCLKDSGEAGIKNYLVQARNAAGETFYKKTADDGSYLLRVTEGDFQLIVHPPGSQALFWTPCDTPTVSINGQNQTVQAPEIGITTPVECPFMEVTISSGLMRRCSTTYFSINYCNNGNQTASNVQVQVTADPLLSYQSSTLAPASQNGSVTSFNLPDMEPGDCGSFNVNFLLSCDATLDQTICAEAHIFPDTICLPPGANWDGSKIKVTGVCNGQVEFKISNIGNGDMTQPADYVIIEDQIMYFGAFKLDAQEDTTIIFQNPGSHAYYLRAEQSPGAPVVGQPSALVQDCGGVSTFNLALQLPQNNTSPWLKWFCRIFRVKSCIN